MKISKKESIKKLLKNQLKELKLDLIQQDFDRVLALVVKFANAECLEREGIC